MKKSNNFHKGRFFEDLACKYLLKKGYKIIKRNLYSKFGEIDILATKNKRLIIVEVKSGVFKYQNINKKKLSKIVNTFLIKNSNLDISKYESIQIDVIFIDENKIEHIENVFV